MSYSRVQTMHKEKLVLTTTYHLRNHLFVPHYLLEAVFVTQGGICATELQLLQYGARQGSMFLWQRSYTIKEAVTALRLQHERGGIVKHWFDFAGHRKVREVAA
jgi:hypothetical protein